MECAAFFVAHFFYNQNLGSTDKRWGPQFISPKSRKGRIVRPCLSSAIILPRLQRLDVSGAFGHQVAGAGVLADLFTVLLVIARCGIAPGNDDTVL